MGMNCHDLLYLSQNRQVSHSQTAAGYGRSSSLGTVPAGPEQPAVTLRSVEGQSIDHLVAAIADCFLQDMLRVRWDAIESSWR